MIFVKGIDALIVSSKILDGKPDLSFHKQLEKYLSKND